MSKTQFGTIDEKGRVTNTIEVDINLLPSADPFAFAYGIHRGQYHLKNKDNVIDHGSKHSELAQEYLRGFLFGYKQILIPEGTKIRKGQEQSYALLHLDTYKHE